MSDFRSCRRHVESTGRTVVQLRTLDGRMLARDTAGKVPEADQEVVLHPVFGVPLMPLTGPSALAKAR